jgi:cbb3-type cytochrome oxidase cytochrome c subunit
MYVALARPLRHGETQYDYPQLWGTRRIGPDLAREHALRSDDWHYAHLFNPRATVPDSIMPGFSWMFNGSAAKPNQDALDLIAYLRSLGRERELAGNAGGDQVDHGMAMEMSSSYSAQGVPETRQQITVAGLDADAPIFAMNLMPNPAKYEDGREVFQHNCSGCHGVNADGTGIAYPGLLPHPAKLRAEHYAAAHLATVLWDGVYGSSMPAWRQLDKADLEAVTAYIQSLQAKVTTVSMSPQDWDAASKIYAANCVSCHGDHGAGDGAAAGALKPSPVNFHVRQPSTDKAWSVLEQGIPGSTMPAWKSRLSDGERLLLVRYVQGMYDDGQKEKEKP